MLRPTVGIGFGDLPRAAERVHPAIAEFAASEVGVVVGPPDAELAHVLARAVSRARAPLRRQPNQLPGGELHPTTSAGAGRLMLWDGTRLIEFWLRGTPTTTTGRPFEIRLGGVRL